MKLENLLQYTDLVKEEMTEASANSVFAPIISGGDVKSTIETALKEVEKDEIVVILGSFYLMAEARESLGFKDKIDPVF